MVDTRPFSDADDHDGDFHKCGSSFHAAFAMAFNLAAAVPPWLRLPA
jgi:hypothetical protein